MLIIAYFGTLRIHQIAPGEHASEPPRTNVNPHPYRATYAFPLVSWLIYFKTLKNADQIYAYFMKLKLDTHLGLKTFYRYKKNKCFHFV